MSEFSPGAKNLLPQSSTWKGDNTYTGVSTFKKDGLAATTVTAALLANTTPATSTTQVQVSPALQWGTYGWKSGGGGSSRSLNFRAHVVPSTGGSNPIGEWKLQYSVAGAAYADGLQYFTNYSDGLAIPKFVANGLTRVSANNSSTIDTLQSFDMHNPSGSRVNLTATFNTTIRWGIQVTDQGTAVYKSAGSGAQHNFQVGSTIGSTSDVIQIYSGGIYDYGGLFANGKITAGQANTNPPGYLNTFGSFAVRGKSVTDLTYTIGEGETIIYADASAANVCTGTPSTSCASTGGGEAGCNARSTVGCSYFAGESCAPYGSVDQSTCETGKSGCTFDQSSCDGANNTDQSTCEGQNTTYGGSCSWDTSTCPAQSSTASCSAISGCTATEGNSCSAFTDTASCNGQTPCSPTVDGDCTTLSDGGGDGTNCATQPECSYDGGSGVCSGFYFTACTGNYFSSCDGNLCTGNYFNGNCSGTFGAGCVGSATCVNFVSSGTCAGEPGCTWSSAQVLTLPISANAASSDTARMYWIKNIGASGTVNVVAGSGDTLESSISLTTTGSGVLLHFHPVQKNCSIYSATNQATCETGHAGCGWVEAVVCGTFNGDQSLCESNGCTYSDPNCTGAGSAASCNGFYIEAKKWFKHSTI